MRVVRGKQRTWCERCQAQVAQPSRDGVQGKPRAALQPPLFSRCAQGMGQLVEAVADAELALSLDPNNKEIETQLKGLRIDLRDADTAKQLQQQLQQQQQLAAAPSQNFSVLSTPAETNAEVVDEKTLPAPSEAVSASSSKKPDAAKSKPSVSPAAATADNAAPPAPAASPASPVNDRLVSANSVLQVMYRMSSSCRSV